MRRRRKDVYRETLYVSFLRSSEVCLVTSSGPVVGIKASEVPDASRQTEYSAAHPDSLSSRPYRCTCRASADRAVGVGLCARRASKPAVRARTRYHPTRWLSPRRDARSPKGDTHREAQQNGHWIPVATFLHVFPISRRPSLPGRFSPAPCRLSSRLCLCIPAYDSGRLSPQSL